MIKFYYVLEYLSFKCVYLLVIFGGYIKKLLFMLLKICCCKILCNYGKIDNRGYYIKKKIDNVLFFKMFIYF